MSDFYYFDIGSRRGVPARWYEQAKEINAVGFEPDEEECDRLNESTISTPFVSEVHYPTALSNQDGIRKFYVVRDPALSGFYKPIKATFEQFEGDPDRADVLEALSLRAESLSTFCNSKKLQPSFMKIDAQGAEFDIISTFYGLREVLGVEIELQVLPLYDGKFTNYSQSQAFLESLGFDMWWIRPQYWKFKEYDFRRIAWFDALYINSNMLDDPRMKIVFKAYDKETAK